MSEYRDGEAVYVVRSFEHDVEEVAYRRIDRCAVETPREAFQPPTPRSPR